MLPRNNCAGSGRMPAIALLVCVGAIATHTGDVAAQEKKSFYNEEDAKLKNPVTSNEESIAAGKKIYQSHCASCHGRGGKGDGGQALSGGEPSDLTDDTWDYGSTDGEIFVAIRDGLSA